MGRQLVTVKSVSADLSAVPATVTLDSATANAFTYTGVLNVPAWARYADFYLNVLTITGTTKTVDLAFSYVDPLDKTTTVAYPGSGITQVTASGLVIVAFDPIASDDDTGPIYTLHGPLPPQLYYSLAFGTKSENEVQTIDLGDIAAADTFKLTFNGHETVAITYSADMTTDITAALVGLADFVTGDVVVTKTDTHTYVVTFEQNVGNQDVGAITITSPSGFTPTGVTETNKGVAGDEVYDVTLSAVYSA